MQSYSQAFHNAISANTREIRGYIKFNGTFVLDGEGGLISFKTTQTAMEAERFCVGSVCSAMCEATFFNEGLSGSGVSLANSYFDAYIGVVTDPDNNTTEYVCVGRYYISEITRSTATTKIVGYDIAGRLSMDYAPTVTAGSNGYLAMDILNDIIDQTGVNGGQHFTTYGSTTYVPTLFEGTCRAQWGWLCSLIDGTASNYSGSREESTLGYMKGYVVGNSAANPYAIDDNTTYIDGLSVGDEFTVTSFTSGTTEEPIVVGNGTGVYGLNPYMTQAVATTIEGTVDGYDYYPVTLHWRGDPCLDLMDELSVTSGENTYNVVVMKIETTFNGGLEQTINCWGDSEEYYAMSTSPTQGQINRVSSLVQEIQQAIETADGGVITKILDTDGTWKELVIANNQDLDQATSVWRFNINGLAHSNRYQGGTYTLAMDTQGRIVANVIQTGILQDAAGKNSWNLDTGAFTITNGSINITTDYSSTDVIRLNNTTTIAGQTHTFTSAFSPLGLYSTEEIGGNTLSTNINGGGIYLKNSAAYGDTSALRLMGGWINAVGGYVAFALVNGAESTRARLASTMFSTGGSLQLYDTSAIERARETIDGLNFYNASGTQTASYPATGLPMLSEASAVDSNNHVGKVINVGDATISEMGTTSTAGIDIMKAWLKYVCTRYTNAQRCTFVGTVYGTGHKMVRAYIYDTSRTSNGLPEYSFGQLMALSDSAPYCSVLYGGTRSYVFAAKWEDDYVVEHGTSEGWAWRKWASGMLETWKQFGVSIAINSAWQQFSYGRFAPQTRPTAFRFSAEPHEYATLVGSTGWAILGCGTTKPTGTATGEYYLFRPAGSTASAQTYYINVYSRGTAAS